MRIVNVFSAVMVALIASATVSMAQSAGVVGKKYESYTPSTCVGVSNTFCYATFPANPSTSVIEINLVSCSALSDGLPFRFSVQIVNSLGTVFKTRYLGITNSVAYAGGNSFFTTVNEPTSMLLGINRIPRILVEANGVVYSLNCSVSGTTVP